MTKSKTKFDPASILVWSGMLYLQVRLSSCFSLPDQMCNDAFEMDLIGQTDPARNRELNTILFLAGTAKKLSSKKCYISDQCVKGQKIKFYLIRVYIHARIGWPKSQDNQKNWTNFCSGKSYGLTTLLTICKSLARITLPLFIIPYLAVWMYTNVLKGV